MEDLEGKLDELGESDDFLRFHALAVVAVRHGFASEPFPQIRAPVSEFSKRM